MPGALEHPEVFAPRPHGVPVLVSHDSRDLVQVSQIVSHPRREELREGHDSERGVPAERSDLQSLEAKLKEPLGIRFKPFPAGR